MTQAAVRIWTVRDLIGTGLQALTDNGFRGAPLIDGRVLSVKATPENGSASKMSVGISVLPAGFTTLPHCHEAEELAHILSGEGAIVIDGISYPIAEGDIVLTPSNSEHATIAGTASPLVIWWVYAPPGSETRWLSQGALDEVSGLNRPPI
jgi:mannose-6-phosphate isomerase-like protein (cupin superfamily)